MPDSIYVSFLLQLLALAAAAWFVLALSARAGRHATVLTTAGVVLTVIAGLWALGVRPAAKALPAAEMRFAAITSKVDSRTNCVNEPPLTDLNFVRLMQATIPSGAPYALFGDRAQVFQVKLCIAQILLPRVQVAQDADAKFLIFYGVIPPRYAAQARKGNPRFTPFAANFGILRTGR